MSLASIRQSLDLLQDSTSFSYEDDVEMTDDSFSFSRLRLGGNSDSVSHDIDMTDVEQPVAIKSTITNRHVLKRDNVLLPSPVADGNLDQSLDPSQSQPTHSFILSPTRAGAQLALNQLPPEPPASQHAQNSSTTSSSESCIPNHTKEDDDDDDTYSAISTSGNALAAAGSLPTPTPAWISAMSAHLERNHNLERTALAPYIISSYLQLASNLALAGIVAWIIVRGYKIFQHDVAAKLYAKRSAILTEAQRCAVEYVRNECRPDVRAPVLDSVCMQWEECMDRALPLLGPRSEMSGDSSTQLSNMLSTYTHGGSAEYIPGAGGTGSLEGGRDFAYFPAVAETLADIANSFFEPVTIRSLLMFIVLAVGIVYVSNFAFGYLRARTLYEHNLNNAAHHGIQYRIQPQQQHVLQGGYYGNAEAENYGAAGHPRFGLPMPEQEDTNVKSSSLLGLPSIFKKTV